MKKQILVLLMIATNALVAKANIGDGRLLYCENESLEFVIQETAVPTLHQGVLYGKEPRTDFVVTMNCQSVKPQPRGGDIPYVTWQCATEPTPDYGYSVIVEEGGFTGLPMARVSEMTIMGEREVAQLVCQRRH